MRRVRLDEDDLISFLRPQLEEQGYIAEDHEILGFEYKTKRIKKGGDYYKDLADPDYTGEVEIVKWIKVLIGPKKKRDREREIEDEQEEQDPDDAGRGDDAEPAGAAPGGEDGEAGLA